MYSRRRLRVDPEKPALGILGMRAGHQLTGDRKRVPTLWQVHGSEPRSGRSEARGAAAVSADVDLRALDDRRRAACLTDRRAEASSVINDEEDRPLEVEGALAQVGQQASRLAHGGVHGRAFAQGEDACRRSENSRPARAGPRGRGSAGRR